jgi:putative DNA primase/helicase
MARAQKDDMLKKALENKQSEYEHEIEFCDRNINHVEKMIIKLDDMNFSKKMIEALSYKLSNYTFIDELDTKMNLLAFNNGVWDFDSNCFRLSLPSDMVSLSVNYDYTPVKNEQVANTVRHYWNTLHPEETQRNYVLQMFARQLYGDKGGNLFHLHAGHKASASNGKSTFFEILSQALGDYVTKFGVEYITSKRSEPGKPMPELHTWKGRRIVFCSEPGRDENINSGIVKELTGGEKLKYRLLLSNILHTVVPTYKIHLMCNHTPKIEGDDPGLQRRIRKIDYMSVFKESQYVDEENFV